MRIGPKTFGAVHTKWQREINGENYLFHHIKYQNGSVHISASKWKPLIQGQSPSRSGSWQNVHAWVFYPG